MVKKQCGLNIFGGLFNLCTQNSYIAQLLDTAGLTAPSKTFSLMSIIRIDHAIASPDRAPTTEGIIVVPKMRPSVALRRCCNDGLLADVRGINHQGPL